MNRLAQAQEILSRATQNACPFLAAVPFETRAALETQFPNPHDLPETQLQKIATQHGFATSNPQSTPVGARLLDRKSSTFGLGSHASPCPETSIVFAQPQTELEMSVFDDVSLSSLTGWVQNPPLQGQRQDPPLQSQRQDQHLQLEGSS